MPNHAHLSGVLAEKRALRYTPGGVQVAEVTLLHDSQVIEAGLNRELRFEIRAKALGDMASRVGELPLGSRLEVSGFLAPSRQNSRLLILHITNIETEH